MFIQIAWLAHLAYGLNEIVKLLGRNINRKPILKNNKYTTNAYTFAGKTLFIMNGEKNPTIIKIKPIYFSFIFASEQKDICKNNLLEHTAHSILKFQ